VGRESKRDFTRRACRKRLVEVEKNSAGAYVLGFGVEFAILDFVVLTFIAIRTSRYWIQANYRRKAHIEAPHHPPLMGLWLHRVCMFRKHSA
jgi:hypothetical protein